MGYDVVLSRIAHADLAEVYECNSRDNPDAALRVARELVRRPRTIARHPRIGRIVSEFQIEILRELVFGSIGLFMNSTTRRSASRSRDFGMEQEALRR